MTDARRRSRVLVLAVAAALSAASCGSGSATVTTATAATEMTVASDGGAASNPAAPASPDPAAGFGDRQVVAGYTITRVAAPPGAVLPEGVGDVAVYDIATSAGAAVARYLRITPAGGVQAGDSTVEGLLADLAASHGGGRPARADVAGLPSWEVTAGDGTVGIARASEDGPVVVFLGTDGGAVEAMIGAVSAALDSSG